MVLYRDNFLPNATDIAKLYRKTKLNRPVHDINRIGTMYANSNITITAWVGKTLVGVLRGWTDGAHDGYICDLAVDPDHQKLGIGRTLLDRACSKLPQVQFVLRVSKAAEKYYEHLGWEKIANGWFRPRSS